MSDKMQEYKIIYDGDLDFKPIRITARNEIDAVNMVGLGGCKIVYVDSWPGKESNLYVTENN